MFDSVTGCDVHAGFVCCEQLYVPIFLQDHFILKSFVQLASMQSVFFRSSSIVLRGGHPVLKPRCLCTNEVLVSCQADVAILYILSLSLNSLAS